MSDASPPAKKSNVRGPFLAVLLAVCGGLILARTYMTMRAGEDYTGASAPLTPTVIDHDDKVLLWASGGHTVEDGEWFDITASPLDRDGYQFGIGKDTIPAIDQPRFVALDDRKRLDEADIDNETLVIGYEHGGEARAYPIFILDGHELVNDTVGGKPVTVGW